MKNTFLVFNDPMNPDSGLRAANIQEWIKYLKETKLCPENSAGSLSPTHSRIVGN
jgi:hypothetical protein